MHWYGFFASEFLPEIASESSDRDSLLLDGFGFCFEIAGTDDHKFFGIDMLLQCSLDLLWRQGFDLFLQFSLECHRAPHVSQTGELAGDGDVTGATHFSRLQIAFFCFG